MGANRDINIRSSLFWHKFAGITMTNGNFVCLALKVLDLNYNNYLTTPYLLLTLFVKNPRDPTI